VGINVYKAHIPDRLSSKSWDLHDDADASGTPTPGDTIRYTIHLVNVGTAPGIVDVVDDIPAAFASWTLVEAAGGTDASTSTQLVVQDVPIAVDGSADIVLDAVLADGTEGETVVNHVDYDATPDGNVGRIASPPFDVAGGTTDEDTDLETEPVTEPSPEPAPDATTDPSADPSTEPADDPGIDIPTPPGDGGAGCGCALAPLEPSALPLLLLLGLALLRRRR
jgi:uncharacterized repeat protein (TIGR01451 family)/MYXO-CTERM domain-containing protein